MGIGSCVYDQATGTYIFIGLDTTHTYRLYMIESSTGQILSDTPTSYSVSGLQCDNTRFVKSFYASKEENNSGIEGTQIYPNPAEDYINILLRNITGIELINIDGKTVFNEEVSTNHYMLNLKEYKKGNYILKVRSGDMTYTEKIMIQ